MKWRERKQRHGDIHFPMGGRGKRATPPKSEMVPCSHRWSMWYEPKKCNICVYCHVELGPERNNLDGHR